jgi:hypothetical protein
VIGPLSELLSENVGRWVLAIVSVLLLLWAGGVHTKLYKRIQLYARRQRMPFDYSYGLALDGLALGRDDSHPGGPQFQVGLNISNVVDGPLRYEVDSFDVVIDNRTLAKPSFQNRGGVIPRGCTQRFMYPAFARGDITGPRPSGVIRFSVKYGHPDIGFVRKAAKTLTVQYRLDDRTEAVYTVDSESDGAI